MTEGEQPPESDVPATDTEEPAEEPAEEPVDDTPEEEPPPPCIVNVTDWSIISADEPSWVVSMVHRLRSHTKVKVTLFNGDFQKRIL